MNPYTVRIFDVQAGSQLIMETEPIHSDIEGLNCLSMFEELYLNLGFVITRPFPRRRHFRAFHKADHILLDVYLTDAPPSLN